MSLKRLEPATSCANRLGCYHSASKTHVRNSGFINQGQFKDPASHMCLAVAVVAFWSLTQEVAIRALLMTKYLLPGTGVCVVRHWSFT